MRLVRRNNTLIVVQHPVHGDIAEAEEIVSEIRRAVAEAARLGTPAIFHDATDMDSATPAYAAAFKRLESEIGEDVKLVVCVIPKGLIRVLARSVAFIARKPWVIVADPEEARARLASEGYAVG